MRECERVDQRAEAEKLLKQLGTKGVTAPGEAGWNLGGMYPPAKGVPEADGFKAYFKQCREETGLRMMNILYNADGSKNKWWQSFSKRKVNIYSLLFEYIPFYSHFRTHFLDLVSIIPRFHLLFVFCFCFFYSLWERPFRAVDFPFTNSSCDICFEVVDIAHSMDYMDLVRTVCVFSLVFLLVKIKGGARKQPPRFAYILPWLASYSTS